MSKNGKVVVHGHKDSLFWEDERDSWKVVDRVAKWFKDVQGCPSISLQGLDRGRDEPDASDLFVKTPSGFVLVEVKRRPRIAFTSVETFPYPTVFVGNRHTWEAQEIHPDYIVVCDKHMTGFLFVSTDTYRTWSDTDEFCKRQGKWRRGVLNCPTNLFTYRPL